jgi:hypothetical protein
MGFPCSCQHQRKDVFTPFALLKYFQVKPFITRLGVPEGEVAYPGVDCLQPEAFYIDTYITVNLINSIERATSVGGGNDLQKSYFPKAVRISWALCVESFSRAIK